MKHVECSIQTNRTNTITKPNKCPTPNYKKKKIQ